MFVTDFWRTSQGYLPHYHFHFLFKKQNDQKRRILKIQRFTLHYYISFCYVVIVSYNSLILAGHA